MPVIGAAPAAAGAASGILGPIIGGLGSVLGGLFGKSGQSSANRANLRIARENREFQERMSSTAYQRAAKDLEAAGLNRILAIGQPSSTPAGNIATMQNVNAPLQQGIQGGINSAIAIATMKANIRNINARTGLTEAHTDAIAPASKVGGGLGQLLDQAKQKIIENKQGMSLSPTSAGQQRRQESAKLTTNTQSRQNALMKIKIPKQGHQTRIQHALVKTDEWVKAFITKYRGAQPTKEQIQRIFDTHYEIRKGL